MDTRRTELSLAADRRATQARIASMTADLEGVAAASAGSNIDDEHDPEGSTVAFERAQLSALLSRAREHLADVDAALERLSGSGYGWCERCGGPIAEDRLAALPATRLCIACASRDQVSGVRPGSGR